MVGIWVAMLGIILVGLAGFAIDMGYSMLVAHHLQIAADAASLAGALKVRQDTAEAHDLSIVIAGKNLAGGKAVLLAGNLGNDPAGDVVIGRFNRETQQFEPTLTAANAVKVVARRTNASLNGPLELFFGGVFGVSTVEITRDAIAMTGGGTGAGIIVLNSDKKDALTVKGNVILRANDGNVQVNSTHLTEAAIATGGATIDVPAINLCGAMRTTGGGSVTGEVNTGVSPMPDPLAYLPAPPWDPASDRGQVKLTVGGRTIGPGYYSGGIDQSGGTLTLTPGIYVLGGVGLSVTGNSSLIAEGVMFYVLSGTLNLAGTGVTRITPPDPDRYGYPGVDTYEGVSVFQARTNTEGASITGTSLLDLQGTVYVPKADLKLSGTGDGFGNQLITDTLTVTGDGIITIRYQGREPAVGRKVFLVE